MDIISVDARFDNKGNAPGWDVTYEIHDMFTVRRCEWVSADSIPVPNYPTIHQIAHVLRTRQDAPKSRTKPRKGLTIKTSKRPTKRFCNAIAKRDDVSAYTLAKLATWTSAHDACQAVAIRDSLDLDSLVEFLDSALESLKWEYDSREHAKRTARKRTGLTSQACERISNDYRDYSTIEGWDIIAEEIAADHPELGWYPSDTSNGQKLWELVSEENHRKPKRLDPATIQRAAEMLATRYRSDVSFAEWQDDQTFEAASEPIPF